MMSCAISAVPWASSNDGQALEGWLPSAMFTPRTRSLILTIPIPPQSPTHGRCDTVGVLLGTEVAVAVPVAAAVGVGVAGAGAPNSYAPMSQIALPSELPSTVRAKPR